MAVQQNAYPLRVDSIIMETIKVIANENGRSVNKEIEALMKAAIIRYESENGIISVSVE